MLIVNDHMIWVQFNGTWDNKLNRGSMVDADKRVWVVKVMKTLQYIKVYSSKQFNLTCFSH